MPVFPVLGQIGGGIGGKWEGGSARGARHLIRPCGAPSPRGEGMGVPRLRARGTDCHGQSADWSRKDRDARRQIFLVKPIDIVGFMCYHALTYKKDMLKE